MLGKYKNKSSKKKIRSRKSRNNRGGLVFVGGGIGDDFSRIIDDAIKSHIMHLPEWWDQADEDKKLLETIVTTLNTLKPAAKLQFLNNRVYSSILEKEAEFKTSPILYSIYNFVVLRIDNSGVEEAVLNIKTYLYDLVTAHIKEVTLGTIKADRFMFYCKMLTSVRDSLEENLIEIVRKKLEGPGVSDYMR
jgi:hypothetical protein